MNPIIWKQYAPTFICQKYGNYDTNDCWDFSGLKCIGYNFNYLKAKGKLSQAFLDFTNANGYWDSAGKWAASERFISILSGVEGYGNEQIQSGILAQ